MMNYRQNRRRMAEKKIRVFMVIPLILLSANICLLLRIESQIKNANITLKQLDSIQNAKEKDI